MNEPEFKSPETAGTAAADQIAALQRQVQLLLVGLVLVSMTLTAFLGLQSRRVGKQFAVLKANAALAADAKKKEDPFIQAFMGRLIEFGKTHPDFGPILAKYKLITNGPPAAASAATPAAAPAKK
ncbi:MAG: hypothetical protein U1F98_11505 [Verrucomicrobiota bacterium]